MTKKLYLPLLVADFKMRTPTFVGIRYLQMRRPAISCCWEIILHRWIGVEQFGTRCRF